MNDTDPQPDASHAMVGHFSRWTICTALLLFAVTWRLWTPQTAFPQIPFFAVGLHVPGWVDWLLFGVIIVSLVVALIRWQRVALAVFAIGTVLLILLDQHRLQPWAYQFVLIAVVLATAKSRRSAFWLRVLVVSLYFHSALSKFDTSFLDTHGQELVKATVGVLGIEFDALSESVRKSLAFSLPLAEMLLAVGLCIPRCRRFAVVGSVVMHLLLFVALGPWGLNHKPGVLIWNLFFIGQNLLLFWNTVECRTSNVAGEDPRITTRLSIPAFVITTAALLPFLEPFGWFDHWPAWGLYTSRSERVAVFVHVLQRDRLPPEVREFTAPASEGPWCRVDCDRWSLATLNAPIYPQGRFRLGVALAIAERSSLGNAIRVVEESAAERRTGRRESKVLQGVQALRQATSRFTLNTKSR